ncbi:MAG: hypothetical protein JWQ04_1177 [Pedosphaera sp.]|nr:hypothetical protein [Pedosphaera sp.]
MQYQDHLFLHEVDLSAGGERSFASPGWCVVRLSGGVGYYFFDGQFKEIAVGELLAVPPGKTVVLRASQIGAITLHYFDFHPERLGPLLTLSEQKQFALLAELPAQAVRHLPVTNETAAQFAVICESAGSENPLLERCRILMLAVALIAPSLQNLPEAAGSRSPDFSAQARFLQLVRKTPQMEMILHSPAELANLCRCSVPHFKRLFRAHFGISFRSKQVQMRLEKARQMLLETDAQLTDLTAICGYKSRPVFNEMFKKQYGVTPSRLRQQAYQPVKESPKE